MSTMITPPDAALPLVGTALIPNAHEIRLALESSVALSALARATSDLTLTLTAEEGVSSQVRIPSSVVRLMFAALSEIASGHSIALSRLSDANPELTTQEAAEVLNVSRPYFVNLLENGEMAFRKVGPQRRVKLREVLAYKQRTDIDRRAALDELASEAQEMRLGYGE